MKRALLCLLFAGCALAAGVTQAQNRVNYWMGGLHVMVKFEGDTAYYEYRADDEHFWRTSASISDSLGDLLFYTNGYRVLNKNHAVMPNGDDLDIGDYESWGYDLLSIGDGALILPVPGNDQRYYLFHFDNNITGVPEGPGGLWPSHLFYCLVDMSLDNGNGDIVAGQKDVVVFSDTMMQMGVKAVKHGNGRDWWLLTREYGSNRYYRFLVDPDGIHGPYTQDIGNAYTWFNATTASLMKFSQDGQRFMVSTFSANLFELYDFDRCSGLLSNRVEVPITLPYDSSVSYGAGLSPSGRFVYVSRNYGELLQFDTHAPDIAATRTVVGADDGVPDPFTAAFAYIEAGADGKLYLQDYNSSYSLSVVHHPDSAGLACGFEQHGFPIPNPSPSNQWRCIAPNAPNYALAPLYGSGCDTVTKAHDLPTPTFTFGVYPNPFREQLQVNVTGVVTKAQVLVTNVLGETVYKIALQPQDYFIHQSIDLSNVPPGVYFVLLDVNNQRYTRKAVKH